jgi:penicillin amidase
MIEAAVAAKGKVSLADMQAIQSDHVSRPGAAFKPFIDAALVDPLVGTLSDDQKLGQSVLDQWATNGFDCPSGLTGTDPKRSPVDATTAVVQNSAGCMLFHTFLRALLTNVFTDDLAVAGQSVNGLHAIKAMLSALDTHPDAHVKAQLGASFCNDVGKGATTCNQKVAAALAQAVGLLKAKVGKQPTDWVWGRVHTMQPVSLLQLVTTNYEPGPYARPGGAFTVDVGNPTVDANDGVSFPYTSGGNVRHISVMDPQAPQVKMQLPGPERDGPTTVIGPNLLGGWVSNTYFDFAFGSQISSVAVSSQTFDKAP